MGAKGYNWNKRKKKWEASISVNGKRIYLGAYLDEKDAIKARKKAETKYAKDIGLSKSKYKNIDGEIFGDYQVIGDTGKRTENSREVIVICRNLRTGKIFETIASRLRLGSVSGKQYKKTLENKIRSYENCNGVNLDKRRNKYRAYITINNKTKHLGYFDNEQDAIIARQKAVNEQIKKLEKEMEQI
ncbi:hypothetical protein [Staphylococcus saprophyticus]|uniref:hypothetical protein n=1 Tax=Staphylococcus saprophyticus TaxID=29385 RepID=UPI0029760C32|nr:hypothetical protein [Staphylococcus saprophyticus]